MANISTVYNCFEASQLIISECHPYECLFLQTPIFSIELCQNFQLCSTVEIA